MRVSEYPRCDQQRYACFANNNGRCFALTSTKFKRICPFYKSKGKNKEAEE